VKVCEYMMEIILWLNPMVVCCGHSWMHLMYFLS